MRSRGELRKGVHVYMMGEGGIKRTLRSRGELRKGVHVYMMGEGVKRTLRSRGELRKGEPSVHAAA